MLATVLEEMPPFPERESSILAKLKKKKPAAARVIEEQATEEKKTPKAAPGMVIISHFYWENYFLLLFFFLSSERPSYNLTKHLLWRRISHQRQFKVLQIFLLMSSVVQQNQHQLLSNNLSKQLVVTLANQPLQLPITY